MIDAISTLSGVGFAGTRATAGSVATAAAGPSGLGVSGLGVSGVGETQDFGTVLARLANDGAQTMQAGEAAAIAGMQGSASVQDVVQAVMSAEQTLQTALAVRDKVVAAYQDISRMAI